MSRRHTKRRRSQAHGSLRQLLTPMEAHALLSYVGKDLFGDQEWDFLRSKTKLSLTELEQRLLATRTLYAREIFAIFKIDTWRNNIQNNMDWINARTTWHLNGDKLFANTKILTRGRPNLKQVWTFNENEHPISEKIYTSRGPLYSCQQAKKSTNYNALFYGYPNQEPKDRYDEKTEAHEVHQLDGYVHQKNSVFICESSSGSMKIYRSYEGRKTLWCAQKLLSNRKYDDKQYKHGIELKFHFTPNYHRKIKILRDWSHRLYIAEQNSRGKFHPIRSH